MKRTVILTVDDETPPPGGNPEGHHMPEALEVWSYASGRTPKRMYEAEVPAGDELTRALDTLTRYHLGAYPSPEGDAAMLVRAAAGLNEKEEP